MIVSDEDSDRPFVKSYEVRQKKASTRRMRPNFRNFSHNREFL